MMYQNELEDQLLSVLFAWDSLEKSENFSPVIDFCLIPRPETQMAEDRLSVLKVLGDLYDKCEEPKLRQRIGAYLTYLKSHMGEEIPFRDYIENTLGFLPHLFPVEVLDDARGSAISALERVNVKFGQNVIEELSSIDQTIAISDIEGFFREGLKREVPQIEKIVGQRIEFDLRIEFCDVPEYWGYWVDGDKDSFRLRLNSRDKPYTNSEAIQFLHHELLAHCSQMHLWTKGVQNGTIRSPWGVTFVAGPEQLCFEGLAQTLPLWLYGADTPPLVLARIFLDRYTMLVRSNIHFKLNQGETLESCLKYSQQLLPYIDETKAVADMQSRTRNSLLRSYQFVYPRSFDTFLRIAESIAFSERGREFLKRCFVEVMNPNDIFAYE